MASFFYVTILHCAFFALFASSSSDVSSCNDEICGSRVSWCSNSCNCSMTPADLKNNCTCCKDCFQCLGEFFPECCSCVGLCRPTEGASTGLSHRSSVATLKPTEDQVNLYEMITTEPLPFDSKWTVKTYPAFDTKFYEELNITSKVEDGHGFLGANCTVAFMKQCLSLDKCDKVCTSMGASSYRWFHTGCCECVGKTCVNFGWLQGLCRECRDVHEEMERNTIDQAGRTSGEL